MLRRNVLIFQTGGLGDFVLTWPFAVALGRIFAQSRIVYVTHQQKGELAKRVLRLEATDIEAGWHGLFSEEGTLPPKALSLLESAGAIYTFLPANSTWHANVQRINPQAKRVEINTRLPVDYPGHLTDRLAEELKDHAPEKTAMEQILRSIASRGIGYRIAGGNDVVIHPGSGSPDKCWPLKSYIELAHRLKEIGRSVRFVIGEVEQDRWSDSDKQQLQSAAPLQICNTSLDLLNGISSAGQFIGNDSGPAHLAGIIGIPTLALFGPTNPLQWKPLGPKVNVLQSEPLTNLTMDQVMNKLQP